MSHLGAAWHVGLSGCAANPEHQLAGFGLLRRLEQDLAGDEFGKDARHRPYVHSKVVVPKADQELRRPVPQRHHSSCVHLRWICG